MFKVLKNSVLYIILFLAFAVRTFAIFLLGKDVKPELYEYNTLALNIIHGKGYIYHFMNTDHRTFCYPGYSYLIAFIHWLTHENYLILELFQVLLSVISCALLYLVASRLFGKKVGLLAAFLMAMHPGLVIYTTKIHDLSFVVLIITLIFWLMLKLEPGRLINNVLIGIVIGVGVLTRPTLIFFLPVYFFYHYFRSKNLKSYVLGSFAVFAFVCLTIMPWTIRNFNIHNRLIFITTTSAEQFWRGNNALSSGTSFNLAGKTMAELAPKEFIDKIFNMTEIEQYDFLYKETLGFISKHPAFFAGLMAKKFLYFWWFSPQTGMLYPGLWTQVYKLYYIFVLTLFILGIFYAIKKASRIDRAAIASILIFMLLISAGNSLYYVESRHRWAVEPLMLIFSAYALIILTDKFFRKATDPSVKLNIKEIGS